MNEQHHTFAQFWKCALQVNSNAYSGTYRGEDHGMDASTYAETLRDACVFERAFEVVGLADHGNVSDAEISTQRCSLMRMALLCSPDLRW